MEIKKLAGILYEAEKNLQQVPMLTEKYPDLTVQDAYHVQLFNINRRMEMGEEISGMKVGLTNDQIQAFLGAKSPAFGILTRQMRIANDGVCDMSRMMQPKVEGELAFVMKKALEGPSITREDVLCAVDYVVPALEIVDSRIKNWKVKLPDMIADNGSAAYYVLGENKMDAAAVELETTRMDYKSNGRIVASGELANVLGNPVNAVAWLVNALAEYGMELPEGSVVLSGAVTGAVPVEKGDRITADFCGIGSVTVKFE